MKDQTLFGWVVVVFLILIFVTGINAQFNKPPPVKILGNMTDLSWIIMSVLCITASLTRRRLWVKIGLLSIFLTLIANFHFSFLYIKEYLYTLVIILRFPRGSATGFIVG